MKVWIVESGERGYGGGVVGVFKDEKDALSCVQERIGRSCFDDWSKSELSTADRQVWHGGCDYISMIQHEVL